MAKINNLEQKEKKNNRINNIKSLFTFFIVIFVLASLGNVSRGINNNELNLFENLEWQTYNLDKLFIDIPFKLNNTSDNIPVGLENIVTEYEYIEFINNGDIFLLLTFMRNHDYLASNLRGAYQALLTDLKNNDNFNEHKENYRLNGRDGLEFEFVYDLNNNTIRHDGIILIHGSKAWFLQFIYPKENQEIIEIKNEIFNSLRFYD